MVAIAWIVFPGAAPAETAAATQPVTITGLESAEAAPMVAATARLMTGGERTLTIDDRAEGSTAVRDEFIAGGSDFIVTGVPFSREQLDQLKAASRELISAPVQAVGLAVFGFAPALPVFPSRCLPTDEVEDPGCTFFDSTRYSGAVRLSPPVLADLFYERSNIWTLPELASSLDLPADGSFFLPPINGPRPLVRNDADASNLYLDTYLATTAAESRRAVLAGIPGANPDAAPGETWPNPVTPSRQGQDNVVAQIAEGLDPGASSKSEGGSVGGASVSAVRGAFELNALRPLAEQTGLFRVELRNAAGEWVGPTTDSITAAVAAAEGGAMGGSVEPVPGAYPITWVNRAYAPSTGLTPDEANGIASMIRVQVTAGQGDVATLLGDGRLPAAQVQEALAAADRIVTSNCAAAKGTVTTAKGLGPFVPATLVTSVKEVKVCQAPTEPTEDDTTTDTGEELAFDDSTFYDTGYYDDSGFYDSSSDFVDASVAGAVDSAGVGAAAEESAAAERVAARGVMPLPIPGASLSPLDRAVTLAIGAAAFLLCRRAWLRRRSLA